MVGIRIIEAKTGCWAEVLMGYFSGVPTSQPPLTVPLPFVQNTTVALPIGSWFAGITRALGIQPCTPCDQRKQYLDSLVAFRPWGER